MRVFIGVDLDHAMREALARAIDGLRAPAELRWLGEESWHVTLQFLGSVEESELPALRTAIERAGAGQAPFALELGTSGAFPQTRKARVLWAGFTHGEVQLATLCDAVHAQTEPLGFAREERAFRPHVTLARVKPLADVRAVLAGLHVPRMSMTVRELTLFRSHLSSQGARYEALARAALSVPA